MSTYAVTGSASGMGKATADKLRAAGHTVIGVDLKDAEVVADLSTAEGRAAAAKAVVARADGRLDGAVLAAGLGPHPGRELLIAEVNYFGVVELLEAWRPALAAAGSSRVVVFSSNSSTTVPVVPKRTIAAFLAGDAKKAVAATRLFKDNASAMVYAGSKIAVTRWLRRAAVRPEWAGAGIRLNAIAPGAILTPLLQAQLDDPHQRGAIEAFPIPVGHLGDAEQLADWVVFLLGPAAEFMAGSVVFVDGGTDAYFRSEDWPRAVPFSGLRRYLRLNKEFAARKAAAAGS
ncbi:SDR family oxidoreductase [Protaetiibacter intestinalis]|uniref:SDR family oxidoreductase n=1 Tax=Protaetiibacter intestinalis TaxID=2419774 RepID=A0A387B8A3_9MICO|nr:SDR family oxidoreductase [Protaetiibacter intestinalis]AYF97425.1 SDR family oxidoreductase [Protaetiibacter intestinalis]